MKLNILIFFLLGVSVSASGIRGFTPIKGSERRLKTSESDSKSSSSKSAAVRTPAAGSITIKVAEDGELLSCTGRTNKCDRFIDECTTTFANTRNTKTYTYVDTLYEPPSSSNSKSSSKSRRLESSKSKSTSSSEVELVYEYKVRTFDINACKLGVVRSITVQADESSSTSTSTTSKKSGRRLKKSSKEPRNKSKNTERAGGKSSSSSSSSGSGSRKGPFIRLWIEDGDEVLKCSGNKDGCAEFKEECTHKENGKRILDKSRRLESPSKSNSKSTSSGEGTVKLYKLTSRNVEDCKLGSNSRTVDYTSTSTSTSTSKKSRRWL